MKYEKGNRKKTQIIVCVIGVLLLSACSNTKYLTENQSLLVKNTVECKVKTISQDELHSLIKQKEIQKSFFFFRFYTTVYNTFSRGKGNSFKKWLITHVGSEPVIYDETMAEKSRIQLQQFMSNKGFFQATVVKNESTKHKKTRVQYKITANKPYKLKRIEYKCYDDEILKTVQSRMKNTALIPGENFEVQNLENERERITKNLKHSGYYFFEKENITFEADSSLNSNQVNIIVFINRPTPDVVTDSIQPILKHKKYSVRNTYFIINYDYKEVLKNKDSFFKSLDTTKLQENVYLLCKGKPYVNPNVLLIADYIKNNQPYNVSDVEKTKLYLTQNLLFKQVSIEFSDVTLANNDTNATGLLDCFVQISPTTKQSYSVNLEGTTTGGDWGAQAKATYENKNIFHGAEIYNMKIRYSFEQNSLIQSENIKGFNSREYGFDMSIVSPKFMLPFASSTFTKNYGLRTFVKFGYSFQKIPYYERPFRYLSFGYISKNSKYLTQYFTPFEINGVQYINKSTDFVNFINQKNYYKYSYEDYYISSTNYMLVWLNKNADKVKNYTYFKYSIESAGNLLYAYSKLTNRAKVDDKYQMFKTTFAQYIKTDIDYRYYNVRGKELATVYRIFVGLALPYGNSDIIPNIKKYYAGGSTSMRAWSIRTLGPGRYKDPDTTNITYAMGDIKLEANLEQRFPIFSFLNGAVFTDLGNVWSALNNDRRVGAQISSLFYKDLAVSTGIGLRPNFSFFVFRIDFAVKMRDPSLDPSKQWLWVQRKFNANKNNPDYNLTIGIGYPF